MDDRTLIVGAVLIAVTIVHLAVDRSQRDRLIDRVRIRGRKASPTSTPPRSLSPKQQPRSDPVYNDSFPPLRREALSEIASSLFAGNEGSMSKLELGEE